MQKLAEKESERLLKLENILHKRVIGQEEAVTAVAKETQILLVQRPCSSWPLLPALTPLPLG